MKIKDVVTFKLEKFSDQRGSFLKIFSKDFLLKNYGFDFKVEEFFYSISREKVIRGMHFQKKPYEQAKIIYVSKGSITDVLLDLRKDSETYLHYDSIKLNSETDMFLYIPRGIAHGFLTNEENSIVNYLVDNIYFDKQEDGILWNSFGYNWNINDPIISDRDSSFQTLDEYLK
jgi:dTDP-4-dehydrorhamnose 3,5-epimerase/CDP-3, 6-dideoxy-D-glycero-D-glycero-4-hexulose-5-epimerase